MLHFGAERGDLAKIVFLLVHISLTQSLANGAPDLIWNIDVDDQGKVGPTGCLGDTCLSSSFSTTAIPGLLGSHLPQFRQENNHYCLASTGSSAQESGATGTICNAFYLETDSADRLNGPYQYLETKGYYQHTLHPMVTLVPRGISSLLQNGSMNVSLPIDTSELFTEKEIIVNGALFRLSCLPRWEGNATIFR